MNKSAPRILCTIFLTTCIALPALADSVAYTDLGPGGSYVRNIGFAIAGINNNQGIGYQGVADPFTALIGGSLSQIDLGLTNISGTNGAVVSLYTDVSNNLGTLMFSAQLSNQPAFASTGTTLAALSANTGFLVAGDSYFLVVAPVAADTLDVWNYNNVSAQGTMLFDFGNGFVSDTQENTLSAFDVRVNATAVPEPSTWLMLGTELLCLLALAGWRRSASVR